MYRKVVYPIFMKLGGHIATLQGDLAFKVDARYSITKTLVSQTWLVSPPPAPKHDFSQ